MSVLANPKPYMASGIFDLSVFWSGQKSVIPVHYSLWMAEVGCAKVASANVETVFSGAGCISMKSHCLGPQILSNYVFLHYNYKYDWLRPTIEEIVDARNSMVKSRVSRTLSRTGPSLLRRWRRMEMRIKREETRRSITVLFVTLTRKHTQ